MSIYKNTKHGRSLPRTPEYMAWVSMIGRCKNPNNKKYRIYGGRGINVCERWLSKNNGFINFLEDIGERPKGHSLDRWPNNDGDYKPGNVRWATSKEQQNNTRLLKLFIAHGPHGQIEVAKNQKAFARKWGLNGSSISHCLAGRYNQHKNWKFELIDIYSETEKKAVVEGLRFLADNLEKSKCK